MMSPSLSASTSEIFDVVIVGGGPAGAAAAITLATLGRRVLVLEKHTVVSTKLGESLPPLAVGTVKHYLGNIESLVEQGIVSLTSGNIATWGSHSPEIGDFFYTPVGYGLCVNRVAFDALLRDKAREAGAVVRLGAQFRHCERVNDPSFKGWQVDVSIDGHITSHKCRYLLDCSGRHSVVANTLNVARSSGDTLFAYAQRYMSDFDDNDVYTRIEATEDGWFYSNRLKHKNGACERIVVFHADKQSNAAKIAATSSGFISLLQKAPDITHVLHTHSYQPIGKIRGASAASERLHQFAGDAWSAVGDAAQAYDPLSSQGIYKALISANKAGQLVHYALDAFTPDQSIDVSSPHIQRYVHEQEQLWTTYKKQYHYFYQNQPRWSDQPFWRRRQSAAHDDGLQRARDVS